MEWERGREGGRGEYAHYMASTCMKICRTEYPRKRNVRATQY